MFHPWLNYIALGIQCVSFAQTIQIKKNWPRLSFQQPEVVKKEVGF